MSQSFVHRIESLSKIHEGNAHIKAKPLKIWNIQNHLTLRLEVTLMNDGDLLLHIIILSFHSFCLCRLNFPIPQTPGHCLQNYFLAGLLQQLPQPHHLPVLQSGVQEGLPERSPWPLPQQNTQDLEPSGLCSRAYAWPQICSGFPIYIYWLPEAY